jgi:hypothetical protein
MEFKKGDPHPFVVSHELKKIVHYSEQPKIAQSIASVTNLSHSIGKGYKVALDKGREILVCFE